MAGVGGTRREGADGDVGRDWAGEAADFRAARAARWLYFGNQAGPHPLNRIKTLSRPAILLYRRGPGRRRLGPHPVSNSPIGFEG
jgi:hypothetical protein